MNHEPRVFVQITGETIVEYTDIDNKRNSIKKYIEFKSDKKALEFASALCESVEISNLEYYVR